jgi:hypothetical protein
MHGAVVLGDDIIGPVVLNAIPNEQSFVNQILRIFPSLALLSPVEMRKIRRRPSNRLIAVRPFARDVQLGDPLKRSHVFPMPSV